VGLPQITMEHKLPREEQRLILNSRRHIHHSRSSKSFWSSVPGTQGKEYIHIDIYLYTYVYIYTYMYRSVYIYRWIKLPHMTATMLCTTINIFLLVQRLKKFLRSLFLLSSNQSHTWGHRNSHVFSSLSCLLIDLENENLFSEVWFSDELQSS
jgi:hypothetical protein